MSATDDAATSRPRRSDGEQTHAAILDAAMRLASIEGLGSLTIGRLARELGISKSGVFAHFRSKQRLQEETVAAAIEVFDREVLTPASEAPEGLARLRRLCEAYLSYVERGVFPGGCFFAQLLAEFDGPDGPLHDAVVAGNRGWISRLTEEVTTAQRRGEIDAEADPAQVAFEVDAALEMANYLATLHRDLTFVDRGRVAIDAVLDRAAAPAEATSAP
jgi:AcrR family transcriptional regulator